jgi:hypothetical protein
MPHDERAGKIDLLSAVAWDLRALGEAQVRALTSIQRCIEEYRQTAGSQALLEMRKHLRVMETGAPQIREALKLLREALAGVESEHPTI